MKRGTLGREMFHVSAVIDGSILHKMMSLCDGKAIDLKVVAVRTPEQDAAASMTGGQFIHEFSKDKSEFTTQQLHDAGRALGLTKQVLYQATSKAIKERTLRRVSAGTYAPIRLLTGPKKAASEAAPKKPQSEAQKARQNIRYEVSNKEIAIKFFKSHKTVTNATLGEFFEKEKRPKQSASPIITKLKMDGVIAVVEGSDPLKPSYRYIKPAAQGNGHATV